jgi:hypothetical protein
MRVAIPGSVEGVHRLFELDRERRTAALQHASTLIKSVWIRQIQGRIAAKLRRIDRLLQRAVAAVGNTLLRGCDLNRGLRHG